MGWELKWKGQRIDNHLNSNPAAAPVGGLWLERPCAFTPPPGALPAFSKPERTPLLITFLWSQQNMSSYLRKRMLNNTDGFHVWSWLKVLSIRDDVPRLLVLNFYFLLYTNIYLDAPCNFVGGVVAFGQWLGRGLGVWQWSERGASPQMKVKRHRHTPGLLTPILRALLKSGFNLALTRSVKGLQPFSSALNR